MQSAKRFRFSAIVVLTALLTACESTHVLFSGANAAATTANSSALLPFAAHTTAKDGSGKALSAVKTRSRLKTGEEPGKLIGPAVDCDGDGDRNDVRIDFDGDNRPDECIEDREPIPEPPFQQSYTPSETAFYSQLPAVGWNAKYQCGNGLYEISLARPQENEVVYSAEGLRIAEAITYDDLDPNLNHPLIIQDPIEGIRYSFEQSQGDEFYEYAIADYSGSVGLYVYQTGEQILAEPCEIINTTSPSATVPPAN